MVKYCCTLHFTHFLSFLHKPLRYLFILECPNRIGLNFDSSKRFEFIVGKLVNWAFTYLNHFLLHSQDQHTDEQLIELLQTDADRAIELLFRRYYAYTVKNVLRVIPDAGIAEDLSQEVFFELWKKRERLQIKTAVKAYLRRSAVNKALNYLRDNKIVFAEEERAPQQLSKQISAQQHIEKEELELIIQNAIDNLPDRCRVAFSLSRFEHKSYQEIADLMGISIKTVENQIGKALKILREVVAPFVTKTMIGLEILLASLGLF